MINPHRSFNDQYRASPVQVVDSNRCQTTSLVRDLRSKHNPNVKRKVDAALDCVVDPIDSDDDLVQPPTDRVERFRIDDKDKVEEYLRDKLKDMQQLAVKRIAKAWIKGICPKKQAKFPYQNKKRERAEHPEAGEVPEWWPSLDVCRFVEPDHIKRSGKLNRYSS
jgi:hypothetical protein